MGEYIKAGKTGDYKDGSKRVVSVEGTEIMLARVGNKYYAVSNRCPHMGGSLASGVLKDTIITCPLHGSQFDISNGKVIRWLKGTGFIAAVGKALKPPKSLPTYNVRVDGEDILIEI